MIVAVIHTQGAVLKTPDTKSKYIVLELGYVDICGTIRKFLVKSPTSWTVAKSQCNEYILQKSLDTIMTTEERWNGYSAFPYSKVLEFLNNQYTFLHDIYGENVLFGFKGKSLQWRVLQDAGIPAINMEIFGCPKLPKSLYGTCSFHPKDLPKHRGCAFAKAMHVFEWFHQ